MSSNPKYDLYNTKQGTSKREVYDWYGTKLSDDELNKLRVGDCVRLILMDKEPDDGWEKIYFEITKISYYSKGGVNTPRTFHGKAMDTYRYYPHGDERYVKTGDVITFQRDNIIEIPRWTAEEQNTLKQENVEKVKQYLQRSFE